MRNKKGMFMDGHKRPQEWTKSQTDKVSDEKNYAWKGEKVSYRGLHQWIRRKKGIPDTCCNCGKVSQKPRVIQWANVDGKYRRDLDDYIPLCCSCHKYHDLALNA